MRKRSKFIMTALSVLLAVQTAACGNKNPQKPPATENELGVWGTYSTAKVLKDPAYNVNNARLEAKLDVSAAKGESESAQIIVTTGDKPVGEYTVETAELKNKDGVAFSADNVEVFFQHYVYIQRKSSNGQGNADYFPTTYTPDALIPQEYSVKYKENSIEANVNQGITFDFHVPADTAPGTYTGEFTLKLDGASHSVPVTLNVWDFDVSKTNGINLWDIVDGYMSNGELNSTSDELYYSYYDALLKYKLNAYHFYDVDGTRMNTTIANTWAETLRKYWQNPAFNGVFLPDIGGESDKIFMLFESVGKACIEDGINYFEKIRFYHQSVDEPQYHTEQNALGKCVEIVNATNSILKRFANTIIAYDGFSDLNADLQTAINDSIVNMPQVVTTFYEAAEELKGLVNAYCPKIYEYESTLNRRMYAHNKEVTNGETWVYTCVDPIYPYPSYHIDDFLLGGRVLKWMQKDYGIDSYLMWAVNAYSKNLDTDITGLVPVNPYDDPRRVIIGVNGANGDGFMFYPMAKYEADEPLPSIRLLGARDGQEDYDTLCTLENAYAENGEKYGFGGATENLRTTLSAYYDKLYTQVKAENDDATFERVRLALGNLTEAACGGTKTTVIQQRSANGSDVSLRIYSEADEVLVNGGKLTKIGGYFLYGAPLKDGSNSVEITYVKGGESKTFEFFLLGKVNTIKLSELDASKLWANTGSSVSVNDEVLSVKAVSQGDKLSEIVSFELDVDVPVDIDYEKVDGFSFTVKNTCANDAKFSLYLNAGTRKQLVDTMIVYAYETYDYSLSRLYEWVNKLGMDIKGLTLRFDNADSDLKLLPDRTLEFYDFKYTLSDGVVKENGGKEPVEPTLRAAEKEEFNGKEKYISHFDCYEDMVICSLAYAGPNDQPYNTTLGAAKLRLNTDKNFVSEGDASMLVQVQLLNHFKTMIYADNYVSKTTDASGAESICLDVFNPGDKTIEFTLEVIGVKSGCVLSVTVECEPHKTTTVKGVLESELSESVLMYTLEMKNLTDNETFELYLDNFYWNYENE